MLGDAIAAALPELRAQAESRMRATVTIRRPGVTVTDPATGEVSTASPVVYSGKARWKAATTTAGRSEVGTATVILTPGAVHLPVGNPDGYHPEPGDVIECVANPDNPSLVGARATVSARVTGDDLTAYRIPIEEA